MQFTIQSKKREEIIDITNEVKEKIKNKKSSAALVYVPHATAGIIVNENYDQRVCQDIITYLRKQIPQGIWKHDKIDGNADSHIKASIIGPSEIIPIKNGKLELGTWQGIALIELDGPRKRKIILKTL